MRSTLPSGCSAEILIGILIALLALQALPLHDQTAGNKHTQSLVAALVDSEKQDTTFASATQFAAIKPAYDEWTWIIVAG